MNKAQYFDLAFRGNLTINCLTGLLDIGQKCLPYFDVIYNTNPPYAKHCRYDYGDATSRYVDALALMRIMTGSKSNIEIDEKITELMLSFLGLHGLSWWDKPPYQLSSIYDSPGVVAELGWSQASTLNAFITKYVSCGDEIFIEKGKELINGISEISLNKNGMRYFPKEARMIGKRDDILYPPQGWDKIEMTQSGSFAAFVGVLISPLIRFYKETGYELAAELAYGFSEYIIKGAKIFREDGRFYDMLSGHFYGRVVTAFGILQTGLLLNKPEYVKLAEKIYIHAKEWGTSFGWFPEDLSSISGCETCCITQMIEYAIILGKDVDSKYWDDAERFGRNQLLENQLIKIDWVDNVSEDPNRIPPDDPMRISRDNIMKRAFGGFAGWSEVNDWVTPRAQIMSCCNAHGARGLYDLWHYSITEDNEEISINMLFSRATRKIEIRSSIPYLGCVEVHLKKDCSLKVRIPLYVNADNLKASLNNEKMDINIISGWLKADNLQKGDVLTLNFDLPEKLEEIFLGYDEYKVRYKGDTVLEINPHGKIYPLYERMNLLEENDSCYLRPKQPAAKEINSI